MPSTRSESIGFETGAARSAAPDRRGGRGPALPPDFAHIRRFILRTSVGETEGAGKPPSVLVTARRRGEGVTTIAIGLAEAFHRAGDGPVALVHADPHGSTRLIDRVERGRTAGRGSSNEYGFDLIRPANAAALTTVQAQFDAGTSAYRVLVVDGGSLEGDVPYLVRPRASFTLLVIDARTTTLPMLERLAVTLQTAEFPVDGLVLNRRQFYIPMMFYGLVR